MLIPEQMIAITVGAALAPLLTGSVKVSKKDKIVGTIAVMGFVGTFAVGAVVVTKYTFKTGISYIKHYMKNTERDNGEG